MMLFRLARRAKGFLSKSGWLVAEVVFVFLGMYGAFLLERSHDDDMDLLRKRQILDALVQEFIGYSDELAQASGTLDEGYGVPFFSAYPVGEKPYPVQVPLVGMGSVNTGIWEAMLQSGGMEILEVRQIQKVQSFFKNYQDFLQLLNEFNSLYNTMILPERDQNATYFYQDEGIELRDKYKWYVNQLFKMGMSLRALKDQAVETKDMLQDELHKTLLEENPDYQTDENSTH